VGLATDAGRETARRCAHVGSKRVRIWIEKAKTPHDDDDDDDDAVPSKPCP
jgi:hypothetical protein